jgi:hypothetical protein
VCPRDKCTQEDLDGGLTAIHEHCQTDMEEGNNAVVLINLALNNYTLGWRAMCAFEGRAPCASHVINTVQKQGHLELTNDYMEQLVSGRVEDMSPWISAYSSGKLCTSCGAAFFTNVRKIRPGILETYFGKSILNTCGQEFLTENVTVEDDPNAPSRTLTRPSASASANSGTTQIASGPLALAAAGVLAFSAYIL